MTIPKNVFDRMMAVRLFAFDVDGVLTDGGLILDGDKESKRFHVHDGAGISIAQRAGYHVAIISGRGSEAVSQRAEELRIKHVHQHVKDKVHVLEGLCEQLGLEMGQVMYMGDDLPDLPIFTRVGLAIAPFDAVPDVKERVHHITATRGGQGAVREAIEMILRNQGTWGEALANYLEERTALAQ